MASTLSTCEGRRSSYGSPTAGPGIDFRTLPKATLVAGFSTAATLGMGFTIMLQLCDRVLISTHPGRTVVVLECSAPADDGATRARIVRDSIRGRTDMTKRVLILTDRIGRGDDELGRLLMRNFVYSLARDDNRPAAVMMMNEGVRLACEGSEVLDDLRLLAESGVAIKACGTCLDFLELTEKLAVGEAGTMPASVAAMLGDDQIVTIA